MGGVTQQYVPQNLFPGCKYSTCTVSVAKRYSIDDQQFFFGGGGGSEMLPYHCGLRSVIYPSQIKTVNLLSL